MENGKGKEDGRTVIELVKYLSFGSLATYTDPCVLYEDYYAFADGKYVGRVSYNPYSYRFSSKDLGRLHRLGIGKCRIKEELFGFPCEEYKQQIIEAEKLPEDYNFRICDKDMADDKGNQADEDKDKEQEEKGSKFSKFVKKACDRIGEGVMCVAACGLMVYELGEMAWDGIKDKFRKDPTKDYQRDPLYSSETDIQEMWRREKEWEKARKQRQ